MRQDSGGNSTEHTAYLRLKHGIKAPQSGSITTNGKVVACLAIRYSHLAAGCAARSATATFAPPDALKIGAYGIDACPTLYNGQSVHALLEAHADNNRDVTCRIYVRIYSKDDSLTTVYGPSSRIAPGSHFPISWTVPSTKGYPIAEVGVEITSEQRADGAIHLDYLTWEGTPDVIFARPDGGSIWRRTWVNGVDHVIVFPLGVRCLNRTSGLFFHVI